MDSVVDQSFLFFLLTLLTSESSPELWFGFGHSQAWSQGFGRFTQGALHKVVQLQSSIAILTVGIAVAYLFSPLDL